MSNWLLDEVGEGDLLALTLPAGRVHPARPDPTPIVAFAGGSGITPVISVLKSALASTDRPPACCTPTATTDSVIFRGELDALVAEHPGRLEVVHHLDTEHGFVHSDLVREFVDGEDSTPTSTSAVRRRSWTWSRTRSRSRAVPSEQVFIERFAFAASVRDDLPAPRPSPGRTTTPRRPRRSSSCSADARTRCSYQPGETLLETARRAGLRAPFSCEAGSCATCMARLQEGEAKMRVNNALDARTRSTRAGCSRARVCRLSATVTVVYE